MNLKTVIINSDLKELTELDDLICHCHGISMAGSASGIEEAVQIIHNANPDLVFLDMEISGDNSFRLLERFADAHFHVVFLTAHAEYSTRVLRILGLDYILKPIQVSDVQAVADKLQNDLSIAALTRNKSFKAHTTEQDPFPDITLCTMKGYYPVKMNEIIYCKGDSAYTHFYLTDCNHHLVAKNLGQFDDLLCAHRFYRIHKSFLINLNHIKQITRTDALTVTMSNHDSLPVSSRKKEQFIHAIKGH